jgi:hypothetical protein
LEIAIWFWIISKAGSDAGLFHLTAKHDQRYRFVPRGHYNYNGRRLKLPPACGYLWSVAHESLTIFAGCRHCGLPVVAIISQASAQAGLIRFVGRNGALRKMRRSFAEK